MLRRQQEGVFSWFALADAGSARGRLARLLISRLPEDDPVLAADRRMAAQALSERARVASDSFRAPRRGLGRDDARSACPRRR